MKKRLRTAIVAILRAFGLYGPAKRAQELVLTRIARQRSDALHSRFIRIHSDLIREGHDLEAVYHEGNWLVSRVTDFPSPMASMTHNRERLEAILDGEGIENQRIPIESTNRFRLAVMADEKQAVWTALHQNPLANSYVYADLKRHQGPLNLAVFHTPRQTDEFEKAVVWRYFECASDASADLTMGDLFGCEIEFWQREDDVVVAPRWNRMITRFSGDGLALQLPGGLPFFDEPLFPVDVVFTWVDGSDPKWLAKKNTALAALGVPPVSDSGHESRFESRDELRSALRSLETYADFVRHIYIVTDDQIPTWLAQTQRLTIVDHREIIPEAMLPTFNSHVMEARLHHISGLAEHFLYMNDDFLFGRRVVKDQFFTGNGLAKFFLSRALISSDALLTVDRAAQNTQQLIRETFGRVVTQKIKHAPYSLRRSVLYEIEERFPAAVEGTLKATFRSSSDLPIASSFHHYYGYMTGRAVPSDLQSRYVDVGSESFEVEAARLARRRNYDTVCVNDTLKLVSHSRDQLIRDFLHQLQPNAASWESTEPGS